jgi:hypothetical protein
MSDTFFNLHVGTVVSAKSWSDTKVYSNEHGHIRSNATQNLEVFSRTDEGKEDKFDLGHCGVGFREGSKILVGWGSETKSGTGPILYVENLDTSETYSKSVPLTVNGGGIFTRLVIAALVAFALFSGIFYSGIIEKIFPAWGLQPVPPLEVSEAEKNKMIESTKKQLAWAWANGSYKDGGAFCPREIKIKTLNDHCMGLGNVLLKSDGFSGDKKVCKCFERDEWQASVEVQIKIAQEVNKGQRESKIEQNEKRIFEHKLHRAPLFGILSGIVGILLFIILTVRTKRKNRTLALRLRKEYLDMVSASSEVVLSPYTLTSVSLDPMSLTRTKK